MVYFYSMAEHIEDTIVALATPPGIGAIGMIRLSGNDAIAIANTIFKGKNLLKQKSHSLHFGQIIALPTAQQLTQNEHEIIDEVVASVFKNPKSFTGEDVVEISGHGSPYILQKIIEACIAAGARMAKPGEFTQRAFLNGKLDLAQAEAVADLIAANSKAAQQTALNQLRGGFSSDLKLLREELINFAALIELELDFSDEDVEFADRNQLKKLIDIIYQKTTSLIESFKLGNAIKNGISVVIIGKPNAGKSTLLNALLNEERAIVSDIAGTTRDTIEETLNINGILFRLIDTAGIRAHSADVIENMGIERSKQNAEKADMIIHLIDATDIEGSDFDWLKQFADKTITVLNKADVVTSFNDQYAISISARQKSNMEMLQAAMYKKAVGETLNTEATIVTNARHHAALLKIKESLLAIKLGMNNNLSGDLLTVDIRRALHYLGEITGQVEVDRDILGTIFGKFCIGK